MSLSFARLKGPRPSALVITKCIPFSQVLLHLLRASYAAADRTAGAVDAKSGESNGPVEKTEHPIRTIYFESPDTFPEIHSFTTECAER
jgi:hypothetical protein